MANFRSGFTLWRMIQAAQELTEHAAVRRRIDAVLSIGSVELRQFARKPSGERGVPSSERLGVAAMPSHIPQRAGGGLVIPA